VSQTTTQYNAPAFTGGFAQPVPQVSQTVLSFTVGSGMLTVGTRAFRNPRHDRWLIHDNGSVTGTHHKHHQHAIWIVEQFGPKLTLRTTTGRYLAADKHHHVYLCNAQHSHDTQFQLEYVSGLIALRGHHGRYVGIHGGGGVKTHHHIGEDELFEWVM